MTPPSEPISAFVFLGGLCCCVPIVLLYSMLVLWAWGCSTNDKPINKVFAIIITTLLVSFTLAYIKFLS